MTNTKANEQRVWKRPWGWYEVLHESSEFGYKIKNIHMDPWARLSLQKHTHRAEIWTIISGKAQILINSHTVQGLPGDTVHIPAGAMHRIANAGPEPLIFVEVQRGPYLGEDDIQRFDDDYDRK